MDVVDSLLFLSQIYDIFATKPNHLKKYLKKNRKQKRHPHSISWLSSTAAMQPK